MVTHLATLSLAVTAVLITSGCGQISSPPNVRKASVESYQGLNQLSPSTASNDSYNCPDKSNIVPDYDSELDGSGFYTACINKDSQNSILIHGRTLNSNSICIFPAQYIDQDHVYTKPELLPNGQAVGPLSQCVDTADGGIMVNFENINY
ncbi:MAG: hypothetical protein AABZ06_03560, partial [Bdellovibrionota bacterium]